MSELYVNASSLDTAADRIGALAAEVAGASR